MPKKKRIDPLPDEFSSYEEAARFWDRHDTMDYPGVFRTVKVVGRLRNRHYEIPVGPDVVKALQARARKRRRSLGHVTNDLLRKRLGVSG
jgi:CopG antitoxin of type II toxin-antitoxin system